MKKRFRDRPLSREATSPYQNRFSPLSTIPENSTVISFNERLEHEINQLNTETVHAVHNRVQSYRNEKNRLEALLVELRNEDKPMIVNNNVLSPQTRQQCIAMAENKLNGVSHDLESWKSLYQDYTSRNEEKQDASEAPPRPNSP